MITVEENVGLEVLDWGGTGRPVVLLTGLGNTDDVFDDFAPKMTASYHVYGVTRRGFRVSSRPASGYDADRLGDDVFAVVEALKLSKPVIAGHSIAEEELSSLAARHAGGIAGLIYLDAIFPYAFDNGEGYTMEEFQAMQESMKTFPSPPPPSKEDQASVTAATAWLRRSRGLAYPESEVQQLMAHNAPSRINKAIFAGIKKFPQINLPALAICVYPHDPSPEVRAVTNPEQRAKMEALMAEMDGRVEKQIGAFRKGVAGARVVILPKAHHYVYQSNEADVLREMKTFVESLN